MLLNLQDGGNLNLIGGGVYIIYYRSDNLHKYIIYPFPSHTTHLQQEFRKMKMFELKNFTCILVSLYPCIPVSLYPCISVSLYLCIPVSLYLCIPVSLYPCIPVSLYLCISVSLYPCILYGFVFYKTGNRNIKVFDSIHPDVNSSLYF